MKNRTSTQTIILCSFMMLLITMASPAAYAWDVATHAYIEEHLYKKQDQADDTILRNRIYGSYMIDIFNNDFSPTYVSLANYLHDPAQDNFMKLWDLTESLERGPQKAFAYGFVSHNNSWGMDSTAHNSGRTFGKGSGYVTAKSQMLAAMLGPSLSDMGLPLPDDVMQDISHYLVESGVDFLVRSLDPSIGNKIFTAAYTRSSDIPDALVSTYKNDLAAISGLTPDTVAEKIIQSEAEKQVYLMGYGWALTQDNALDLVAQGLALQGLAYFESKGMPAPPQQLLEEIAKQGIMAAMWLCAGDFQDEISATTGWVNGRLSSKGIVW
jgi:hypothetical protein